MNAHTPGPWRCNLGNGSNLDNDPTIWARDGQTVIGELRTDPAFGPVPTPEEMAANADLIVRAVNCHAELMEALDGLLFALGTTMEGSGMRETAKDNARLALAKAKGVRS